MRKLRTRRLAALAILLGTAGCAVAPPPRTLSPVAWTPDPVGRAFDVPHRSLAIRRTLAMPAPEDCARRGDRILACGLEDGRIVLVAPDLSRIAGTLANTSGRPLGMEYDPAGRLIVADARRGLLAVAPNGAIAVLRAMVPTGDLTFPDDVAIGRDGIWMTNASTRNGYDRVAEEFVERRATGQLLHLTAQGMGRPAATRLCFANGIAIAPDGSFLLVAETARYRILRRWLHGPRAGTSDVFVAGLPGHPDNLAIDERGRVWIALITPRDAIADAIAGRPADRLRGFAAGRVSPAPAPGLAPSTIVLLDGGRRLLDLFDVPAPLGNVTSVLPTPDGLVLGTNLGDRLALAAWPAGIDP